MKLFYFLLIVLIINISGNRVYSQTTHLNLNMKDVPIQQVLDTIESQSEFFFLYSSTIIDVTQSVTISLADKPIDEILETLFKDTEIQYFIKGRQILLVDKKSNEAAFFQQLKVAGNVKDELGGPLSGVNIQVEGTTFGVVTDLTGRYSIIVSKPDAKLIFSFIGYGTVEVLVSGNSTIDVTLQQDSRVLDEVVVIGYGTIKRDNLTNAVSQIKPSEVPFSANNNFNSLLFGRAAGLNITQRSAEPGGNIDISIRGRGNPLIVVDGIVIANQALEPFSGQGEINGVRRGGIADLNPADIESVEILKDASASIYGVEAANGVVLITTKKGKAGKMAVTYDGSRSVVLNYPYLRPLNSAEYMSYRNNFGLDDYLYINKMLPFGTKVPSGYIPMYLDSQIQNAGTGTDWVSQVLRNGSIDNHTLTIRGGSDKFTYYLSSNYFNQVGTMKNSDLSRFNTLINTSYKLLKHLSLSSNIKFSRSNYNNSTAGWQTGGSGDQGFGALQAAVSYPSILPVRNQDGSYSVFSKTGNPVSLLDIDDKTRSSTVLANFSLAVDIIPEVLTGKFLYGTNFEFAKRSFFIPSYVFWDNTYKSRGSLFQQERQKQTMEGTISFRKEFTNFMDIEAIAGYGLYNSDETGNGMTATGMLDIINTDNLAAAPNRTSMSSYRYFEEKRSYFIRGTFDIFNRYLLSLAYRLDGIDKFFPDKKYSGFPSASIGWKISNEDFMKGVDFINMLKVRASIGISGNAIGNAAYGQFSPYASQLYFNNGTTIYTPYYLTSFDLPDLVWEKTLNNNLGLDISLLKNKIFTSLDVFSDLVSNLLTTRPTDQLSVVASAYANDGKRSRKGYDYSFKIVNVTIADFQWDMVLNFSHYNYNWVKRFKNQDLRKFEKERDPVNSIYVFKTDGILQVDEAPSDYQPLKARMPGAPKFVDTDGNDTLDYRDVVRYSNDPEYVIGFGNNLRYKNFDLSAFFYAQLGAYDFNYNQNWASPYSLVTGSMGATIDISKNWSTSNPNGIWPGVNYSESVLGLPAAIDTRLSKKDFMRCRNITLGYKIRLNQKLNAYISNLRVYFDIQNAFIITNLSPGDPEVQIANVKGAPAAYPMARTFSFGLNAAF